MMNIKRSLLALILTLTVLFAGSYLVDSYKFNHALNDDLLKIDGVERVEIDKSSTIYKVEVTLRAVDNLIEVYEGINDRIKETTKDERYKLVINSDSAELTEMYEGINLALYEALETGEFVKLGERVDNFAKEYQLDKSEIKVDTDYLYLTLIKEKQELYKVVKRSQKKRLGGEMNG